VLLQSRSPLAVVVSACAAFGLLWWFWPQLAPLIGGRARGAGAIAVLAEDPRRTALALSVWQHQPQTTLWVLGHAPHQQVALRLLLQRGLSPHPDHVRPLESGDDTVGQITSLSRVLPANERRLLLITDSSHRDRALAIARQVLGARGVWVEAPPPDLLPPGSQPERPYRRWRDVLRAQLWRATGWDGRSLGLWLRGAF